MDRLFHALSASTRRDILRRTMTKEITVSELAREYDLTSTGERVSSVFVPVRGSRRVVFGH